MTRTAASLRAIRQKRLDDTVFERMEGHHDKPTAIFKDSLGCLQRCD
jgi:hypothetical protein